MNPQHRIDRVSRPEESPIPLEAEAASPPVKPSAARYAPVGAPASVAKAGPALPARAKAEAAAKPVCPKCGYSVVGLKGEVCPECGGKVTAAVLRSADRHRSARRALGKEYVSAAVTLAVCLGVVAGVLALRGEIADFPWMMLGYAVFVPLGLAVYFVCCLMWIGFDKPWGITALRLAAIYAAADVVMLVLSPLPIRIVTWAATGLVVVALMVKWLELEVQDALLVMMATMAVRIVVVVAILAAVMG